MAWSEGGSPQNSLVDLTQFLWRQEENLSMPVGFGLDYSSFYKELQITSTVKHGPLFGFWKSQISKSFFSVI